MKYHYLTQFSPEALQEINASLDIEFVNIKKPDYVKSKSMGIVATDGHNLAGYIIFVPRKTCYYIQWLVTLPEYRGRGIAKALIRHAQRYHNCLTLYVEPNTVAEGLYLDAGFKRTGRHKDLPDEAGNPKPMYHMRWSK